MSPVSEQQVKIRRRALGRKLIGKAGSIRVQVADLSANTDVAFLTDKEDAVLTKLIAHTEQVAERLTKLGQRLDQE